MGNCNNKVKHTCGTIHQAQCTEYQGSVNDQSELAEESCLDLEQTTQDIYKQLDALIIQAGGKITVNNIEPDETNNIEIDSDDVPEGSVNLYVTAEEKETWNGKQDVLEGDGVVKSIDGVISYLNDTTIGDSVLTSTNPSAITFLRANADNSVSWLNAVAFRTAIGAGTGSSSGTVTSVSALTLGTAGTDLSSSVVNSTTAPVITLNVPNASASNRGVLTTTDWSTFNAKAGLASPAFTGAPTAPTASAGTNTTQLATTAFVMSHVVSGTYTPTFTPNVFGTVSATHVIATYIKIGNIVQVSIGCTVTASTGLCTFRATLPFAKAVGINIPLGTGSISYPSGYVVAHVNSGTTVDIDVKFVSPSATNYDCNIQIQYSLV